MNYNFLGERNDQGKFQISPAFLQFLSHLGSKVGQGQGAGQSIGDATSQALRMQTLGQGGGGSGLHPTPIGVPGPNALKESTVTTADGVKRTITVDEPTATAPTYSGPPEAQTSPSPGAGQVSGGGVSDQSPFWQALLRQVR